MTEEELRNLSTEELNERFNIAKFTRSENGKNSIEIYKRKLVDDPSIREKMSLKCKEAWIRNPEIMGAGLPKAVEAAKEWAKKNPGKASIVGRAGAKVTSERDRETRLEIIKGLYKDLPDTEFKIGEVKDILDKYGIGRRDKRTYRITIFKEPGYFIKINNGIYKKAKSSF